MAPPFNPLAPCCDPLVDDVCGADPNGEFCEKSDRGEKQYCMTLNTYIGGLRCRCADATTALSLRKLGWEMKNNQIARVDKPRREIATLTTPITPVFIREFLGKLPPPPPIGFGGFVSTGLNNYYGNNFGQSLYLRWRLGLGNPYQSWWPYDASDFPEDWWLPDVTDSWNNFFAECGAAPPKGQGLCCEAQAICAAQKHRHLWEAVQRASERNTQRALEGH